MLIRYVVFFLMMLKIGLVASFVLLTVFSVDSIILEVLFASVVLLKKDKILNPNDGRLRR